MDVPASVQSSIVSYYGTNLSSECGYCGSEKNGDYGMEALYLSVDDYQALIDRNWRRSGRYCYRPSRNNCCALYTIKCCAANLKMSRTHKKVINCFNKFLQCGDIISELPSNAEASSTSLKCKSLNESAKTSSGMENNIQSSEKILPKKVKKKKWRMAKKIEKLMEEGLTELEATEKLIVKHRPVVKKLEERLNPDVKYKREFELLLVCADLRDKQFSNTWLKELEIYKKYQNQIHGDPEEKCDGKQFLRFLSNSPLIRKYCDNSTDKSVIEHYGSYHLQYWLDGKIIAVSVIDILPKCVSSVYFFYDPAYKSLTLGTYSALREIELVRKLGKIYPELSWYYMGFYIHNCPKMRYKGQFDPSYLLCPEVFTWHPLKTCLQILVLNPHYLSRLNDNPDIEDSEGKDYDADNIVITTPDGTTLAYKRYRELKNIPMEDEVLEYVVGVGKTCAYRMLLFKELF